jgi:hypothetical protein
MQTESIASGAVGIVEELLLDELRVRGWQVFLNHKGEVTPGQPASFLFTGMVLGDLTVGHF